MEWEVLCHTLLFDLSMLVHSHMGISYVIYNIFIEGKVLYHVLLQK